MSGTMSAIPTAFGQECYLSQRRNALPDIFESVDVTGMAMLSLKCAQCRLASESGTKEPTAPLPPNSTGSTICPVCGGEAREAGNTENTPSCSSHDETESSFGQDSLFNDASTQQEAATKNVAKENHNDNFRAEESSRARSQPRRGSLCSEGSGSFQTMGGFRPETCAKLSLLC